MRRWKQLVASMLLLVGVVSAVVVVPSASAIDVFQQCGQSGESAVCGAKGDTASPMIKNVINTLLYLLGIIAVIMIVIGGIRYTTSNGDSSGTKAAKDTILYAIVGLVIAMMAWAIVNFVVGRI